MITKALIAASSRPIILSISKAVRESYGYQIIQRVKTVSGGKLQWSDGMLYPVLHRLEKEGLIISQWKLSDNGRHRKYYLLTEAGDAAMNQEKIQWLNVHETLTSLWKQLPAVT